MAKLQRWGRRDRVAEPPAGTASADLLEEADQPAAAPVAVPAAEPAPEPAAEPVEDATEEDERPGIVASVRRSQTVLLLQAAHPRQALLTGLLLGLAALVSDRPLREAAVVAATGLVGQAILGWHNDLVDRRRDARHQAPRKPVADGRLEPGSTWYALVVGVLLVVPLSVATGVTAGTFYLGSLAVGLLGNVVLRRGKLSFVSWAAQFGLYAPYLSFGGWGGGAEGDPPEPAMVALFAALGIGVHVLRSIWGLVADDADRWTYLPLVLGRKLGATRLLAVAAAYTALVVAAIAIVGGSTGLRR